MFLNNSQNLIYTPHRVFVVFLSQSTSLFFYAGLTHDLFALLENPWCRDRVSF